MNEEEREALILQLRNLWAPSRNDNSFTLREAKKDIEDLCEILIRILESPNCEAGAGAAP